MLRVPGIGLGTLVSHDRPGDNRRFKVSGLAIGLEISFELGVGSFGFDN